MAEKDVKVSNDIFTVHFQPNSIKKLQLLLRLFPILQPQNFYFRQLRKVKVAPPTNSTQQRVSLLATASTYGLTCIGTMQGLNFVCRYHIQTVFLGLFIFETAVLHDIAEDDSQRKATGMKLLLLISYLHCCFSHCIAPLSSLNPIHVPLSFPPVHISLNCNHSFLCVCLRSPQSILCHFYDLKTLYSSRVGL